MGTPTQFVPTTKIPTKVSSASKIVQQVLANREYITTRANNAHQEHFRVCGIHLSAKLGRTALVVHMFLPMVLELPTVSVLAARVENFPLWPICMLVKVGKIVQQAKQ